MKIKLKTFVILYSIITGSGEHPNRKLIEGTDKADAENRLKALFQQDGVTEFIINDVIPQ